MTEKPLSKRQQNILQFTRGYMDENGRPPTIREIGKAVGINSTSVVNYNLGKLEEKGYLNRDPDVSRGLRLTEKANGLAQNVTHAATAIRSAVERLVRIPLVGDIVAGKPVMTGNDTFGTYDEEDAVELSRAMLSEKPEGLFALRVRGDSMIDASVLNGDIVILRQQTTANNGDMVAAWNVAREETTLKHFYQRGNRVELRPANPNYEPITLPADQVRINGKVVTVIRVYN